MLFDYWIGLLKGDRMGALGCYFGHFGYERIADLVPTKEARYVFAYGTLRADFEPKADSPVMGQVIAERWRVDGTSLRGEVASEVARLVGYAMYDTGRGYPAVVWDGAVQNIADAALARPSVVGTLWRFPAPVSMSTVLAELDDYEGIGRLPHRRSLVRVRAGVGDDSPDDVDAWIYEFMERPDDGVCVEGGDWKDYAIR